MTVIAYDGKTLAADKQSTVVGYAHTVSKIFRVPGGRVGFPGQASHCMALLEWFKGGRKPAEYPKSDDPAGALFIADDGSVWGYGGPHPEKYEDKFVAQGCGRDYALAAMYLGKPAREAVEIACALDVNCGNGVDVLE